MKKKKILISSYNLDYGGIETSLVNLLNNFNYEKYDVTLVLERCEGVFLNDVPNNIKIKEYKVSDNKNILIRKITNLLKRLIWILFNYHRYNASICYATYSGPCGFVARTASNNKILYVHSNYYEAYDKDEKKVLSFFDNLKIKKYNHIVFVSNESKKDMIKIYPDLEERFITINNLINSERIIELSKEKVDISHDNKVVFLFVGRLDESSKKISRIIELAKKCQDNNDSYVFWIVGTGPDEDNYKKMVKQKKLNNVLFLGSDSNPYKYIKACDYILLTSRYEGFPVVYNEAIILNKPIISTINVSDDYISIPNRFGYIIDVKNIYNDIRKIVEDTNFECEKIDYNVLNKRRLKILENIMEKK